MRSESDRPVDCKGAGTGWLHRLKGQSASGAVEMTPAYRAWLERKRRESDRREQRRRCYPAAEILAAYRLPADKLGDWSDRLGVSAESFARLGCGLAGDTLLIPEADEAGIVGLQHRNGEKRAAGKRGLFLPDLHGMSGPLVIVEGSGDTLASTTLGLPAIGLPSASGGIELLTVELLLDVASSFAWDDRLLVIADNDAKSDGRTPGFDSGKRAADHLARATGREVAVIFPPAGEKDVRDFLNAGRRDGRTLEDLRRELLLQPAVYVVEPPTKSATAEQHGADCGCSDCTLDSADVAMLRSRGRRCHRTFKGIDQFRPVVGRKPAQYRHVRPRCRCMTCPQCRPLLMARWLEHFQETFRKLDRVHRHIVTDDSWPAFRKRLKRAGGNHVRVKMGTDGDGVHFSIVYVDQQISGGTALMSQQARREVARNLSDSLADRRPVSTSRGWKLPKKEVTEWTTLGSGIYNPEAVKRAADDYSRTAKFLTDDADLFRVKEFTGADCDDFMAGVAVNFANLTIDDARGFHAHVQQLNSEMSPLDCRGDEGNQVKTDTEHAEPQPHPPRPPDTA